MEGNDRTRMYGLTQEDIEAGYGDGTEFEDRPDREPHRIFEERESRHNAPLEHIPGLDPGVSSATKNAMDVDDRIHSYDLTDPYWVGSDQDQENAMSHRVYSRGSFNENNLLIGKYRGKVSDENDLVYHHIESTLRGDNLYIPEQILIQDQAELDRITGWIQYDGNTISAVPERNPDISRDGLPCTYYDGHSIVDDAYQDFHCPDCRGTGKESDAYKIYSKDWKDGSIHKHFPSEFREKRSLTQAYEFRLVGNPIRGIYEGEVINSPIVDTALNGKLYHRIEDYPGQTTWLIPNEAAYREINHIRTLLHKEIKYDGQIIVEIPEKHIRRELQFRNGQEDLQHPISGQYQGRWEVDNQYHIVTNESQNRAWLIPKSAIAARTDFTSLEKKWVEYRRVPETFEHNHEVGPVTEQHITGRDFYVVAGDVDRPISGEYHGTVEQDGQTLHRIAGKHNEQYLVPDPGTEVEKHLLLRQVQYDGITISKAPEKTISDLSKSKVVEIAKGIER